MANFGFRIPPFPKRPSTKLLAELRKIVTAHLSDNMNRLLALPQDIAADVIRLAKLQAAKEAAVLKSIRKGTLDRAWVDQTLRQKGCDF